MRLYYPKSVLAFIGAILTLIISSGGDILAQTNVCGFQPGARFTLAGSPYRLTCVYDIPVGDSLVVEPGVQLDLAGQRITVNGRLRLRGTAQDSVFITSSAGLGYAYGVYIPATGTSSLTYVSFRGLTGGTALYMENSVGLNVRNCFFSGIAGMGINIPSTQTLRLSDLKFGNFQTAMTVTMGNVTVANTLFSGLAPRFGINATGTSSVVATNCDFGHPSGPYNLSRNPSGLGCQISNNVCLTTGVTSVAGFDFVVDGNNVAFVNTSTNASSYSWNFGNNTTSTLANPLKTFPVGTYNVCLTVGTGAGNLGCSSVALCKTVSIVGVASIEANHGGNTGLAYVVIKGGGFVPNTQLILRKTGQTDIIASNIVVQSLGTIRAVLDLNGKALGTWDVIITYPNGTTATLSNGFTIETSTEPNLSVSINGPSILRIGFKQVCTVTCVNSGNVTAERIPLMFKGLPLGTVLETISPLISPDSIAGLDTLRISQYPLNLTARDTLEGKGFKIFVINRLAGGAALTLNIIFNLPITTPLHSYPNIRVTIGKPASHFHFRGATSDADECAKEFAAQAQDKAADLLFGPNDYMGVKTCFNGIYDIVDGYISGYTPSDDGAIMVMENAKYTASVIKTTLGCSRAAISAVGAVGVGTANVPLVIESVVVYDRLTAIQEGVERAESVIDAGILLAKCAPMLNPPDNGKGHYSPIVGNAWDPNSKYGPGSGSFYHYINKNAPLGYSINFENAPTANLNAQTVRVTDTLSMQAFDLSSFAFTSVTVGEKTYALPAPAKSFVHDFDFVSQYGVKARVVGTFDATTGIARWNIFSVDPVTNQVTTNALSGFLPPDVVSPRGQGYVSFIVRANAARQTGDIIRNRASIVFDFNPPILTNSWQNTFDLARPVSAVTSVAPTATNNVSRVTWTGTDAGSGIQSYDIYYTTNSRNPRKWLAGTSLTTRLFTGRADSTYCFYSVARDSAGNVQTAPVLPGVCRRIPTSTLASAQLQDNFKVYPNPSTGKFTLESYCRKAEGTVLEIRNMLGSAVYQKAVTLGTGVQSREIDISNLPTGVYILRLQTSEGTIVKKLIKN